MLCLTEKSRKGGPWSGLFVKSVRNLKKMRIEKNLYNFAKTPFQYTCLSLRELYVIVFLRILFLHILKKLDKVYAAFVR